jgi:hypothetical protein
VLKKTNEKRNIGAEILAGLRELKRGEYGRVINVPVTAKIRSRKKAVSHGRQKPPGIS